MFARTLILLLLSGTIAFSYTIVRKDGKQFSGELIRLNPRETFLKDKNGTILKFKADQIDWEMTTEAVRSEEQTRTDHSGKSLDFAPPRQGTAGQKWTGEPLTFDFKDIDIRDFFRFLADFTGMNMILDPAVKGTLTMKLTEVPWDQALDLVCRTRGLGYTVEGNVLRATLRSPRGSYLGVLPRTFSSSS